MKRQYQPRPSPAGFKEPWLRKQNIYILCCFCDEVGGSLGGRVPAEEKKGLSEAESKSYSDLRIAELRFLTRTADRSRRDPVAMRLVHKMFPWSRRPPWKELCKTKTLQTKFSANHLPQVPLKHTVGGDAAQSGCGRGG
ncbi:hypothetical protein NHX12_006756 [Muraenolepis orangiensis]|uniref:Uncharacterized protein n=1 Tax=Muraenolepis orangiensis TaxID=630683 RepID=A0A9Q0DNL5_9TELE|nr:hypothetical protein NHX12_006756 [Muraenolepis orangiensis]